MIWDLWNLTCLGDALAWPFAKRESHGGRPDWACFRTRENAGFDAYMNGDRGRPNGWRAWPDWLREAPASSREETP